MSNQDTVIQTQPRSEYSDNNNHQFELADGELKLVTYIADSILYEDPVYLSFVDLIINSAEDTEEPTMLFKVDFGQIISENIENELYSQPNGDLIMPMEEKKKYEMLRAQLQDAIDAIDSLTFAQPEG